MNNQPHGSPQLRTKGARSKTGLLIVLTIGSLVTFSGCSASSYMRQVWEPYDEMSCCVVTDIRARMQAQQLWRQKYAHCYGRLNNARDIRRGFIDGFVETANGGSGIAPIVPPEKYCGIGRKVEATCWYQGYPLGVAAAESTGADNWRRTTISPALAACFATPNCAPGCVPVPDACGCNQLGCNGSCGTVPAAPMIQQPMVFDTNEIQMHQPSGIQEPIRSPDQEFVPEAPQEPLPAPKESTQDAIKDIDTRPLEQIEKDINAPPKPSEAIERAIDAATEDVTDATPVSQPLANTDAVFQVPSHRTTNDGEQPVVQEGPVVAPRFDLGSELPETESTPEAEPSTDESEFVERTRDAIRDHEKPPVVSGPIEMPNIQVSFDWMEPDWLFGEVDITRALLEQQVPSVLNDQ